MSETENSRPWDVNGIGDNGLALIGLPLNKLLMEGKTGFVVVESAGIRSTRNGTELQEGSRTISRFSCGAQSMVYAPVNAATRGKEVETMTRRQIYRYERLNAITAHRIGLGSISDSPLLRQKVEVIANVRRKTYNTQDDVVAPQGAWYLSSHSWAEALLEGALFEFEDDLPWRRCAGKVNPYHALTMLLSDGPRQALYYGRVERRSHQISRWSLSEVTVRATRHESEAKGDRSQANFNDPEQPSNCVPAVRMYQAWQSIPLLRPDMSNKRLEYDAAPALHVQLQYQKRSLIGIPGAPVGVVSAVECFGTQQYVASSIQKRVFFQTFCGHYELRIRLRLPMRAPMIRPQAALVRLVINDGDYLKVWLNSILRAAAGRQTDPTSRGQNIVQGPHAVQNLPTERDHFFEVQHIVTLITEDGNWMQAPIGVGQYIDLASTTKLACCVSLVNDERNIFRIARALDQAKKTIPFNTYRNNAQIANYLRFNLQSGTVDGQVK
ncbi:hypothetical protein F4604DRAFT_1684156 [Suillus subluteus]|nr:hypothetical protein F4604DRAFT_1684156 [Suillus subluteus]